MKALTGTVMLTVRDLDRSVSFYRDTLGFTELASPILPLLTLGGLRVMLVDESPPTDDKPGVTMSPVDTPDQTPVVLTFEVDDVPRAYNDLRERGAQFLTGPTRPPWGGLRCFLRDPDGYLIEFEQRAELVT